MGELYDLVNSHGVAVLIAAAVVALVAGAIPPLPENASFWEQWGYRIVKGAALNSRALGKSFGVPLPELEFPSARRAKKAVADTPEETPDPPQEAA